MGEFMKHNTYILVALLAYISGCNAEPISADTCLKMKHVLRSLFQTVSNYENKSLSLDAQMALIEHLFVESQKARLKQLTHQFEQSNCKDLTYDEQ